MTELTEGDLMALQSQWVELQASAREWLKADTSEEMRKARYESGNVLCAGDSTTGKD